MPRTKRTILPLDQKIHGPNPNRRAEYDRRYNEMRKQKLVNATQEACSFKDRSQHLELMIRERDDIIKAKDVLLAQLEARLALATGSNPPHPQLLVPSSATPASSPSLTPFTTLEALAQMSMTLPPLRATPSMLMSSRPLSPVSTSSSMCRSPSVSPPPSPRSETSDTPAFQQRRQHNASPFSISFLVNASTAELQVGQGQ